MTQSNDFYSGTSVKKSAVKQEFTNDQVNEFIRCSEDPMYFITNYIKVVHPDPSKGLIPFKPWEFQERFINTMVDDRFVIAKFSRQSGKCAEANTLIKVRNKKTNEIMELTVEEFHKMFAK